MKSCACVSKNQKLTGIKNVYLAGPMEYAHNEGLNWRRAYERAFNELGIKSVIPNDEEKHIKREYNMSWLKENDLPTYIKLIREFIDMDLKFVEKVDMIVVRWEGERTAGTIGEAQHAYLLNKPTYLVTSLNLIEVPGWFLACFTKTFKTLKELTTYIREHHLEVRNV